MDNYNSQLAYATTEGDLQRVKKLIDLGYSPHAADHQGWTYLHMAAYDGHYKIVEELISRGVDIDQVNYEGLTPLFTLLLVSKSGHHSIYQNQYGYEKTMELLLNAGANTERSIEYLVYNSKCNYFVASFPRYMLLILLEHGAKFGTAKERGVIFCNISDDLVGRSYPETFKKGLHSFCECLALLVEKYNLFDILTYNDKLNFLKNFVNTIESSLRSICPPSTQLNSDEDVSEKCDAIRTSLGDLDDLCHVGQIFNDTFNLEPNDDSHIKYVQSVAKFDSPITNNDVFIQNIEDQISHETNRRYQIITDISQYVFGVLLEGLSNDSGEYIKG